VNFFRRKQQPSLQPINLEAPVDWDAARRAAERVNAGDVDGAQAICDRTPNPRHTAFAAFRYIDCEDAEN